MTNKWEVEAEAAERRRAGESPLTENQIADLAAHEKALERFGGVMPAGEISARPAERAAYRVRHVLSNARAGPVSTVESKSQGSRARGKHQPEFLVFKDES